MYGRATESCTPAPDDNTRQSNKRLSMVGTPVLDDCSISTTRATPGGKQVAPCRRPQVGERCRHTLPCRVA